MNNQLITQLASNCFFVKGARKNLIIDLQNNEWYHVDFDVTKEKNFSNHQISKEDLDYMLKRQILIQIPKKIKKNFIPTPTSFDVPSIIESAIIDRNDYSTYSLSSTLEWLNDLIVKFCQVRYFTDAKLPEIKEILESVKKSNVESLDLIMPYSKEISNFLLKNIGSFPKLHSIIFHSSPFNLNELTVYKKRRLFMILQLKNSNSCGIVHPGFFSKTKLHVLKSMNFNSCLYKKIGVDVDGSIKNCPSMKEKIGHLNNVKELNFNDLKTEYWNIKKDDIEICKDCEFRYICNDCRVQVNNKYARPLTCKYNPYQNKWEGQQGYKIPVPRTVL